MPQHCPPPFLPLPDREQPSLRFAPSPNGRLHLGHALSACINAEKAQTLGAKLFLRMEDIDLTRCTPEFEAAILEDLTWLGLRFEPNIRRQSQHFDLYRRVLEHLIDEGLAYPSFLTRGEVKAKVDSFERAGGIWPRDPDGAPIYPAGEEALEADERARCLQTMPRHAWRLDMKKAVARINRPLTFCETGDGPTGDIMADPLAWGDVVLWRSDAPASYHLAVTIDDALQGISHVVRGLDLFAATSVHVLLQSLLGLPTPTYHHHRLILGDDGRKLSKSLGDTALSRLRNAGNTASDIRRLIGL